ncbi:B-box type zinc finger ncl-1 isoform X1 [Paramuricea clavata]|uniref:B-box type zinc finger ncl-1 isoform X1 n=1 Tax=Paramuricea clavata TaxID=317549 RepID=A0A7D9L2I0_PARCT|nr:B-box type zinc finger ncl-1 isoform X1 [Paramuricea clavata]
MSTTTLKPDESVVGLPASEFILKLLTTVGPNRGKEEAFVCSFCQKEPAITICIECELLLCHSCCGSHNMWPRNKSHILVSISEIINRDEQQQIEAEKLSCTRHKDAVPKFYCETCKELICIECMASVHTKPGHTCLALHEIYRKQQNAVKSKCATINAMLIEGKKALETVSGSKATYENTAKDIKVKHIAQKDEMVKFVADGINKILNNKIQEVDKVYDPACEKLSYQSEMISIEKSLQRTKIEKSLQRTNIVLENSKLEELLSVQKVIDDDIRMLQSERPQNLITSFQV